MDDLARLFNELVDVLAADDPERPRTPFQVSELYQSILPYRTYKRRLHFDTNQDYEMAVLRLLAGEGGYASVEPAEVQEILLEEAQSVNPNPGAFRQFAAARVQLKHGAVRSVMTAFEAFAPPAPETEQLASVDAEQAPASQDRVAPEVTTTAFKAAQLEPAADVPRTHEPSSTDAPVCPDCDEALPVDRITTFCPFCGHRVKPLGCSGCGDEIEPGWSFCVSCGQPAVKG